MCPLCSPTDLHALRLPRVSFGQVHLHQIQRGGAVPEEPVQPAALQRGGVPVVRERGPGPGPVHPGRGLLLLLLGLHQT